MFDKVEPTSPMWRTIRREIEERISFAQLRLEVPQDADQTERLRGQIQALRGLIDKFDPPVRVTAEDDDTKQFKGPIY